MNTVHVVVPEGIDDPRRPSGGNVYDRRACDGLTRLGWSVQECRVGSSSLGHALARVPAGGLVLVDGLLASDVPDVIVPHVQRLRLVVILHMPLDSANERAVLSAATAVVTTSQWTRRWLLDTYRLAPGRIAVAEPGVEPADLAPGTPTGRELLCVGAVTATKGHDVLVAALSALADLEWRCVCVGALDIEPGFVDHLRRRAERSGIGTRLHFTQPLAGGSLTAAYAGADLLVSASRAETYGMVATEALARGLPVLAARVGGLPEALGRTEVGERPGQLVPAGNPRALATALRHWLSDPGHRTRLRKAAQARRLVLSDWSHTARRLSRVLDEL